MWNSGAEYIVRVELNPSVHSPFADASPGRVSSLQVIAEQAFKDSFDVVAESRQYLLELSEREKVSVPTPKPEPVVEDVEEVEPESQEEPRPRGRKTPWRKNPSTSLPRDFVKDLKTEQETAEFGMEEDRHHLGKVGPDGKERVVIDGIEFEETDFGPLEVAKPANTAIVEKEKIPGCYIVAPVSERIHLDSGPT